MFCGFPNVSSSDGFSSSIGWLFDISKLSFFSSGIGRMPKKRKSLRLIHDENYELIPFGNGLILGAEVLVEVD